MSLPTDYAERKLWQMWTYLTEYFPDTFEEVVRVAIAGNKQHNPGQPLHWAREKSTDQWNTAFRHMWDHWRMKRLWRRPVDTDGCYHLAKAIWRLSAELQLHLEGEMKQNAASIHQALAGQSDGDSHSSEASSHAQQAVCEGRPEGGQRVPDERPDASAPRDWGSDPLISGGEHQQVQGAVNQS